VARPNILDAPNKPSPFGPPAAVRTDPDILDLHLCTHHKILLDEDRHEFSAPLTCVITPFCRRHNTCLGGKWCAIQGVSSASDVTDMATAFLTAIAVEVFQI
jgi:hypothetical protein